VYVGAIMRDGARIFAIVNANTLDTPLTQQAVPMDYDSETVEQRKERRRTKWTPASVIENWGTFSQRGIR
jgi:hypothetical protein